MLLTMHSSISSRIQAPIRSVFNILKCLSACSLILYLGNVLLIDVHYQGISALMGNILFMPDFSF